MLITSQVTNISAIVEDELCHIKKITIIFTVKVFRYNREVLISFYITSTYSDIFVLIGPSEDVSKFEER
jgi:hypothetical protein